MKLNLEHPSIIKFLIEVSDNVLKNVSIGSYFKLTGEKKTTLIYVVFKLIKSSVMFHVKLSDLEYRTFLTALQKKNEEIENYEFAAILREICTNFDSINEVCKPLKKIKKDVKKEHNKE